LTWCARSINLRRDKLAQLGLSPPLQEKLRTHCTRKEPHYKKARNHYLNYENRKCDEKFEINHDVFESSDENQFLTYAYCINHRAEQATRSGHNHVIMRIYKIGQSAQGEDLMAVEMWAENEDDDEVKAYDEMPESRLMGNIHGNEDQGVFILMPLINEYSIATSSYRPDVYQLLAKLRVHILVSMNPDGFRASRQAARKNRGHVCWLCGRNNHNNIDLNRNFPYLFDQVNESIHLNKHGRGYMTDVKVQSNDYKNGNFQPETIAIIRWSEGHHFVVSAMVHSGAWVFNYPYDTAIEHPYVSNANPSDDEAAFIHIGQNFTSTHGIMKTRRCPMDKDAGFVDGITNGAAWYSLQGTLQDYGYIGRGIMEVTLEMGCDKTVRASQTSTLYAQNRDTFRYFLWQTYTAVYGTISDRETHEAVADAEVFVFACFNQPSVTSQPHCEADSHAYTFNRLSAITYGKYGQFFKVYYPQASQNVICIRTEHKLYDDHVACDWASDYSLDRPDLMARKTPFTIKL